MKLAIIGAGASGLFITSYLKRKYKNIDITLYERNKGLGRKLLASGNGKCNFMNYKAIPSDYNNPLFMEEIFKICKKEDILNYFQSLGLMFKFDNEGRMYPETESSETILKLFTHDLSDTKVLLEHTVNSIKHNNGKVIINDTDVYDLCVLASGSNASIDLKKVSSTYEYLKPLNLKMVPLKSSLVGFKSKENLKLLSGYRAKAMVTYYENDIPLYKEGGEVIFKDDGISGICVMNISHIYNQNSAHLTLDLMQNSSVEEISYKLNLRKKVNSDPKYYLDGICHPKMISYLIKNNILEPSVVAKMLKSFKISILDTYDFKNAQVLKGGIDISEVNLNLSLKNYNNIYATGELLDINGKCGGYNLTFAFISAMIVARDIEEKL